jgi:DNA replication protein DnaC
VNLEETHAAAIENDQGVFYECPKHGRYAGSSVLRIPDGASWLKERHGNHMHFDRPNCESCMAEAKAARDEWEQRKEVADRWLGCGIPRHFRNRRFSNFRAETAHLRKARAAVIAWLTSDVPGLVLIGPPGCGKTHLAAAAAADLVRAGHSPQYRMTPDFLSRMRASFDRDSEERSHDVASEIKRAGIWILDEIGATTRSAWEQIQLSDLIDQRYRNEAPFVLILGERGADRLAECAIIVPVIGSSYRAKAARDDGLHCPDDFDPGEEPALQVCVRGSMASDSTPAANALKPIPSRDRR